MPKNNKKKMSTSQNDKGKGSSVKNLGAVTSKLITAPVSSFRMIRGANSGPVMFKQQERLGALVVPGSDYTPIQLSDFRVLQDIPVQPGLPIFAPWLALVANQFTRYRIKNLEISFTSCLPTTAGGQVMISFSTDTYQPIPLTDVQQCEHFVYQTGPAWTNFRLKIPCPSSTLYVRSQFIDGVDMKTYDLGRIFLSIDGFPSEVLVTRKNLGFIDISYEVELLNKNPSSSLTRIVPVGAQSTITVKEADDADLPVHPDHDEWYNIPQLTAVLDNGAQVAVVPARSPTISEHVAEPSAGIQVLADGIYDLCHCLPAKMLPTLKPPTIDLYKKAYKDNTWNVLSETSNAMQLTNDSPQKQGGSLISEWVGPLLRGDIVKPVIHTDENTNRQPLLTSLSTVGSTLLRVMKTAELVGEALLGVIAADLRPSHEPIAMLPPLEIRPPIVRVSEEDGFYKPSEEEISLLKSLTKLAIPNESHRQVGSRKGLTTLPPSAK